MMYKVCGNCKTFFCSFKGNGTTKLSRRENLIFDKPAVQKKVTDFMFSEFTYLNDKDNTHIYARMKYLLL